MLHNATQKKWCGFMNAKNLVLLRKKREHSMVQNASLNQNPAGGMKSVVTIYEFGNISGNL